MDISPAPVEIIRGSCWRDVAFLDQNETERAMFDDISTGHDFLVRGPTYPQDGRKVPTGDAVYRMVVSEVIRVEEGERYDHIAQMGRIRDRIEAIDSIAEPPEILVMNFQYPGGISHVAIFCTSTDVNISNPEDGADTAAFKRMWQRFKESIPHHNDDSLEARLSRFEGQSEGWGLLRWIGDTTWAPPGEPGVFPRQDFKNQRYKMIPVIKEGNWLVKAAMTAALPPQVPCLLGRHLQMRYFRGSNYVEIDVDIGSSSIASRFVSVMRSFNKTVKMEYAIVIQGESEDELSERILACSVCNYMDVDHNYSINDRLVLPRSS